MDRPSFRLNAYPASVFIEILREARSPLDAAGLKQRLRARGVEPDAVDAAWKRAQPAVRRHANVGFDATRGGYQWTDAGTPIAPLTAEAALDGLLPARLTARKANLAGVVRTALKERDDLVARLRSAYQGETQHRAAIQRQQRIDALRAVAEVAAEAEELVATGAGAAVTAERLRAVAAGFGLRAIGRVGEATVFAPALHTPIGDPPPDGSPVSIIRPGYGWHADGQDVLLLKAHVVAHPASGRRLD